MPVAAQQFPGGEQSIDEIFQNMNRAGYLQPVIDLVHRLIDKSELELRNILKTTLITDVESLAVVHRTQGKLAGYLRLAAILAAKASLPGELQKKRKQLPEDEDAA